MSQPATAGSVKITLGVNDAEPAARDNATAAEDPRAPQNWAGPCTAPETPQPVTDMVAKRGEGNNENQREDKWNIELLETEKKLITLLQHP